MTNQDTLKSPISILFYGVNEPVNNHEYIVNDIFTNYKNIESDYILVGQEDQSDKTYDVFVYNCVDSNRQSHFGFPPSYEQTKKAVLKFKPKIIIQLADECWEEHNEIHNLLGNFCNLFLKQHRHESQLSTYTQNTTIIPLGYVNRFYNRSVEIKPIKDRKYTWTWVGVLKNDRQEMINHFWSMWKNVTICNAYIPGNEVFDLYSESIFVPCGRGNFSLDCFRNYEATIAGAIPVIVGSAHEIDWTYKFEETPPWIYAESWWEATKKCQDIQFNYDKLQEMQNENIAWWNRMVSFMRDKVSEALENELSDYSLVFDKVLEEENVIQKPISLVYYTT